MIRLAQRDGYFQAREAAEASVFEQLLREESLSDQQDKGAQSYAIAARLS